MLCPSCGNTKELYVKDAPGEVKCDKCGAAMDTQASIDLVEELHKLADANSTAVEFISGESEEGGLLVKAFGGLAGILRFRVN
jgi:peptide chain release factor subunit 1